MISTGNDIVALGSINKTRTCEPRFYSKILSAAEQELYYQLEFTTLPFENYVWLLWSVKESAFKYLQRNNHQLIFSPIKISVLTVDVHPYQHYSGSLQFGHHYLFFRSTITNDWISTVVNEEDDFEYIFNDVQAIEYDNRQYQSDAVRAFALDKLNAFFEGEFAIEKSESNYPILVKDAKRVNTPISLSHDGYFVAYSFNFNPTL
ncbi:4'-phosphopantetheinyl transferase superfamily protein [Mucilaginibacter sp. X4EP1]|jgi:phosphopantetheinyl transferase (holo-ACP synthase)|uniref:4'-phosphopantetheinyl transferase family protein n=1 Tax=Mucilaginibacter sp. X4EP1 TaxID=2723092 RepID=UPI002169489E|nr:4'-phosphopantetheinyl transferase superfamily protein [Mucilaginibacter sp. X4EP1]MCS3815830.1 phosphopantetheinyl transferase (holo-ACP synthase) [Mucilaginibacter sp. X4EP1]